MVMMEVMGVHFCKLLILSGSGMVSFVCGL